MDRKNKTATIERIIDDHKIVLAIRLSFMEGTFTSTELTPVSHYWRLSISADVFQRRGKRWVFVTAGQCQRELRRLGANKDPLLEELLEIWDRYHLNDIRAGTRRQSEMLNKCFSTSFDHQVECLKSNGVFVDRGYQYGSAWLVERLPWVVKARIKALVKEHGETFV